MRERISDVHQHARAPGVVAGRLEQQVLDAVQRFAVQRLEPDRIAPVGQQQVEQGDQVIRVGRDGQQLATHTLAQGAHEAGARCKSKVRQQRGRVHRVLEQLPPRLPAGLPFGPGLHGVEHQPQPGHGAGRVIAGPHAGPHPGEQVHQPEMALRPRCAGVQSVKKPGQVCGALWHVWWEA
jgi:hypothetical protein